MNDCGCISYYHQRLQFRSEASHRCFAWTSIRHGLKIHIFLIAGAVKLALATLQMHVDVAVLIQACLSRSSLRGLALYRLGRCTWSPLFWLPEHRSNPCANLRRLIAAFSESNEFYDTNVNFGSWLPPPCLLPLMYSAGRKPCKL